jgi:hypothetical protein
MGGGRRLPPILAPRLPRAPSTRELQLLILVLLLLLLLIGKGAWLSAPGRALPRPGRPSRTHVPPRPGGIRHTGALVARSGGSAALASDWHSLGPALALAGASTPWSTPCPTPSDGTTIGTGLPAALQVLAVIRCRRRLRAARSPSCLASQLDGTTFGSRLPAAHRVPTPLDGIGAWLSAPGRALPRPGRADPRHIGA